jgi:molybdopterin-binding protein
MRAIAAAAQTEDSSMKLSARNVIAGTVTAVNRGQTTAYVKIDIGGGNAITASITVEAVDDLALQPGDKVSAIIKASEVIVGK